jgi:hypothetical protein
VGRACLLAHLPPQSRQRGGPPLPGDAPRTRADLLVAEPLSPSYGCKARFYGSCPSALGSWQLHVVHIAMPRPCLRPCDTLQLHRYSIVSCEAGLGGVVRGVTLREWSRRLFLEEAVIGVSTAVAFAYCSRPLAGAASQAASLSATNG